ncbi:MAG: hypothetical protein ABIS06_08775, partial [Vicinamibacterales bacterium]
SGRLAISKRTCSRSNIPRTDLRITISGRPAPTPFGFGGWLALTTGGEGPLLLTSIGVFAQEHLQLRAAGTFVADYSNAPVSPTFGCRVRKPGQVTPTTPAANRLPDIPDFVHQVGVETGIPLPGQKPQALVVTVDFSLYGQKNLNTTGTLRSESAFLFGSRIGVRPSPRVSIDAGISYLF